MIDLKKELNDKQYEAAVSIDGPQLIIAGAGSGKTRMITFKTAFMIENAGIAPEHILALTFTNKAAAEMKERIQTLIGERAKKLTVSTFHSFGLSLIRRYGAELGYSGRFSVYDADDAQSAAKEAAVELKIPLESVNLTETAALFSAVKTGRTPLPAAYKEWYEFYNRRLKAFNAVDFDDLLALPLKLLRGKGNIESRKTLQLIQRAARMPESPARIFGTFYAQRREYGYKHERRRIGHAARRMFVRKYAFRRRAAAKFAALCHRIGQDKTFLVRHAAQKRCHTKRRDLRVGRPIARHLPHKKSDLRFAERVPPFFGIDYVVNRHSTKPPLLRQKPPSNPIAPVIQYASYHKKAVKP